MRNDNTSKIFALVFLCLGALPAAGLAQSGGDRFTATLASPVGGGTSPVMIRIDHYSTDEEVQRLAGILKDKGPDALRDALWDLEAGYIRVGGGLAYPIAAARSKPTENGRVIRLMMDRPISFRESVNNTRSTDYPFGYIEINVDEAGKGEGQFFAAAKVTLAAGTVEIESYSPQPLRLLGIEKR